MTDIPPAIGSPAELLLYSLIFIAGVFIAFFIPGRLICRWVSIPVRSWTDLVIPTIIGLVAFILMAVIFGMIGMRFLTYAYLGVMVLYSVLRRNQPTGASVPPHAAKSPDRLIRSLIVVTIVIGVIGQTLKFVPTAFRTPEGISVYTASSDDLFWHTALSAEIARQFPPQEPGLSGVPVRNYHFLANVAIGEFIRIFRVPVLAAQFMFFPVFISLVGGLMAYRFFREITGGRWAPVIGLYLWYFQSDMIYIVSRIFSGRFVFSVHPLEDGTMLNENPPRAFAAVAFFLGVYLLERYYRNRDRRMLLVIAPVMGAIIGFKVHTGLLVLSGFAVIGLGSLVRRDVPMIVATCMVYLIAAALYLPVNAGAGHPIVVPFELSRMFVVQDGLGLSFLELRRRAFIEFGNWFRAIIIDLEILAVFTISQFGFRTLGVIGYFRKNMLSQPVILFLLVGGCASFIFGTVFIQPVAGADIFNSYLASGLVLTIGMVLLSDTMEHKLPRVGAVAFVCILLVFTLPRWVYKTVNGFPFVSSGPATFSAGELDFYDTFRSRVVRPGSVLVANDGTLDAMYPYVSVFIGRGTYYSGLTIMERHGVDHSVRQTKYLQISQSHRTDILKDLADREGVVGLIALGGNRIVLEGTTSSLLERIGSDFPYGYIVSGED